MNTNTTTTAPHGIHCGHCHNVHATLSEVKACSQSTHQAIFVASATLQASAALPSKPMATAKVTVPDSKYALRDLAGASNAVTFFEVKTPSKGKWAGFTFVTRLVGHPGSFVQYPVKGAAKAIVLQKIAEDPKAAAFLFADEFSVCARCLSPLTDDHSRAMGLGPTCAEAFA
jgi:hypothetical protein